MAVAEIDQLRRRLDIAKPVIDKLSIQNIDKLQYGWDTVGCLAKLFANFAKPSGEIDLLDGNNILMVGGRQLSGSKFIGVGMYIDNTLPVKPKLVLIGRDGVKEERITTSLHQLDVVKWGIWSK